MNRSYYSASFAEFHQSSSEEILGQLASNNQFNLEQTQRDAWKEEIRILKGVLDGIDGQIYFEYSIPRMGSRVDAILLIEQVLFVIEFKIGAPSVDAYALEQVWGLRSHPKQSD